MKTSIIILKCITNLHVGNGEENYNIIDNEVEKDCVTQYPTIHSSGLKGALREYFKTNGYSNIEEIFGGETQQENTKKQPSPGMIKFLSADMIARPARTTVGKEPYYLITTRTMIERFNYLAKEFLTDSKTVKITQEDKQVNNIEIEGIKPESSWKCNPIEKLLFEINEEQFKNIDLPVMARNKLNNGESKNLWYEEVVPHESIFAFPIIANDKDEQIFQYFIDQINNKIIQIGGNASIGYGLCKVTVLQ